MNDRLDAQLGERRRDDCRGRRSVVDLTDQVRGFRSGRLASTAALAKAVQNSSPPTDSRGNPGTIGNRLQEFIS